MKHKGQPFLGPGNKGARRVSVWTGNENESKCKSSSEPGTLMQI